MKITETLLAGVYIIEPDVFHDERGDFVKLFQKETFLDSKLECDFIESYYSISKKNVIRGMHFQTPPADHTKLVYVTSGKIMDVVVDIRAGSPSYGTYASTELSSENHKLLYIPSGFAHGFRSLQKNSCVVYSQTSKHALENDKGINIYSFGMDWGIKKPIVSARDQAFPNLNDFKSPFIYKKI